MHTQEKPAKKFFSSNLFFALLAAFALMFVAACSDDPTPAERVENAAEEFGDGVEDAYDEMRDRSAGEKFGDAVEEMGEDIQDAAE